MSGEPQVMREPEVSERGGGGRARRGAWGEKQKGLGSWGWSGGMKDRREGAHTLPPHLRSRLNCRSAKSKVDTSRTSLLPTTPNADAPPYGLASADDVKRQRM